MADNIEILFIMHSYWLGVEMGHSSRLKNNNKNCGLFYINKCNYFRNCIQQHCSIIFHLKNGK